MVVDIGEVKRHIKPKADSTLYNMRKSDLIEYVRTLEHNYNVGATFLENQAKYIESLAVPGPSEDDPNIMELCFHNGEQHMKEKMISHLRSVAGSMTCITLAQVIKMVEDL